MERYKEIRDGLDTGDIILFAGTGFFSRLIQFGSWSKWSHIGLIVKSKEMDMLLVWESTGLSKARDIKDGKLKKGVQLVTLSSRLDSYKGDISIRKYEGTRHWRMMHALRDFRTEARDVPYEKNTWELIMSLIDWPMFKRNKENDSTLFCSELVAESMKRMGIIHDKHPSNEFTPADFKEGGMFEDFLKEGKSYGPEIAVK